jgi:hypothetical protein
MKKLLILLAALVIICITPIHGSVKPFGLYQTEAQARWGHYRRVYRRSYRRAVRYGYPSYSMGWGYGWHRPFFWGRW